MFHNILLEENQAYVKTYQVVDKIKGHMLTMDNGAVEEVDFIYDLEEYTIDIEQKGTGYSHMSLVIQALLNINKDYMLDSIVCAKEAEHEFGCIYNGDWYECLEYKYRRYSDRPEVFIGFNQVWHPYELIHYHICLPTGENNES